MTNANINGTGPWWAAILIRYGFATFAACAMGAWIWITGDRIVTSQLRFVDTVSIAVNEMVKSQHAEQVLLERLLAQNALIVSSQNSLVQTQKVLLRVLDRDRPGTSNPVNAVPEP